MSVALGTRRQSAVNVLRYLATGVLVVAALVAARHGWLVYVTSPWTRGHGSCAGRKRGAADFRPDR